MFFPLLASPGGLSLFSAGVGHVDGALRPVDGKAQYGVHNVGEGLFHHFLFRPEKAAEHPGDDLFLVLRFAHSHAQAVEFGVRGPRRAEREPAFLVEARGVDRLDAVQRGGFEIKHFVGGVADAAVHFELFSLVVAGRKQCRRGGQGANHFFHIGHSDLQTDCKDRLFRPFSWLPVGFFCEKRAAGRIFMGLKSDLSLFMCKFARFIDETF